MTDLCGFLKKSVARNVATLYATLRRKRRNVASLLSIRSDATTLLHPPKTTPECPWSVKCEPGTCLGALDDLSSNRTELTDPDRDRLIKCCRLFASNHDGER